jgi:DNA-binding NarL/FixJ family response regulator
MSTVKQISIFIAEDQLIPRMGLRMLLEQTSSFAVVGEAEDGESAVQKIRELKPDIVMMDLEMPKMGGVEATEIIKKEMPHVKVLIFTSLGEDASIFAALKAGADGYCLKNASAEMLASAIHSVLSGNRGQGAASPR